MDGRDRTNENSLSLNILASEICKAYEYPCDFTGALPLFFNQGGLQRPKMTPEMKRKIEPTIAILVDKFFFSKPAQGKVILHVQAGKFKVIDVQDVTEPLVQSHEEYLDYSGFEYGSLEFAAQIREYPEIQLCDLIKKHSKYPPPKDFHQDLRNR